MTAIAIEDKRLTETFAALANTTRRVILARLSDGAATVNELAEPFALSLPAVSKHIKVLELAGLVIRGRQAQHRPVALDAEPLAAVSGWAEQSRPLWEERLDRMDDYLRQLRSDQRQGERRLVYTESMCDAEGNVTPAAEMGMPDDHPTETRVVIELADDGGKTKLTLMHVGVPADSPGATGWTMALDKLTAHVEAASS